MGVAMLVTLLLASCGLPGTSSGGSATTTSAGSARNHKGPATNGATTTSVTPTTAAAPSTTASTVTVPPIPTTTVSREVAAERQIRATSAKGIVGTPERLNDLLVTVALIAASPLRPTGDDVAVEAVTIKVRNLTTDAVRMPSVQVSCTDGPPNLALLQLYPDTFDELAALGPSQELEGVQMVGISAPCPEPVVRLHEFGRLAYVDFAVPA